ncbi:hypothetical protein Pst134EA_025485 [Puccinia striiformis f. sp. tritici]|uniref:hypothetical protein n=1 Tax=Puccinia striiformis f. sp. tritici TaxID=168172 RepID=UPI002007F518|nr:hypothetical protein Pst134EA_025485 [Puccinia striiformis f. sp. tritici]KAH9443723.1 hypothetical protein Pst134EB_026120 [Puccinia striiformis f. sp. tritici]KAH9451534.1 hypothetical protein Pst134EA_025485 [Puccinia striiformis f. sp. tritici]
MSTCGVEVLPAHGITFFRSSETSLLSFARSVILVLFWIFINLTFIPHFLLQRHCFQDKTVDPSLFLSMSPSLYLAPFVGFDRGKACHFHNVLLMLMTLDF